MGAGVTRNLYPFSGACLGNLSIGTKGELFLQNNMPCREPAAACVLKEKALNESLAQTQQVSLDKDEDRALCLVSAGLLLSSNSTILKLKTAKFPKYSAKCTLGRKQSS